MASDHPPWAQHDPASRVSSTASRPEMSRPPACGRTWRRMDSVPGGDRDHAAGPGSTGTRRAASGGGAGEGQHRSGGPTLAESGQGGLGRLAARDHHGGHRGPHRRLEGVLPPGVDLDHVEQGADHAVDPGQQLGAGRTPGLVQGPLQGVGPGGGPGQLLLGLAEGLLGRLQPPDGPSVGRLGLGHHGLEVMAGLLGLGHPLAQLVVLALEESGPALGRGQAGRQLGQRPAVPLEGVLEGADLPLGHRHRLLGLAQLGPVPPGVQMGLELSGGLRLGGGHHVLLGGQGGHLGLGGLQLAGQTGALGLQRGDHVGVGGGVEGLGQRALALAEHAGQAAGPLHHALGPPEGRGQVGLPLGRHLVGRPLGVGVQLGERAPQPGLGGGQLGLGPRPPGRAAGRAPAARSRPRTAGRPAARRTARCRSGPRRPGARGAGSAASPHGPDRRAARGSPRWRPAVAPTARDGGGT